MNGRLKKLVASIAARCPRPTYEQACAEAAAWLEANPPSASKADIADAKARIARRRGIKAAPETFAFVLAFGRAMKAVQVQLAALSIVPPPRRVTLTQREARRKSGQSKDRIKKRLETEYHRRREQEAAIVEAGERLSNKTGRYFALFSRHRNTVTIAELAKETGLSTRTVRRRLKEIRSGS